jgi:hypothetical protein
MENLLDILKLLSRHDVEFVVVGGYAVVAYGGTMVTQDVDICCDFSPANLLRLQNVLKPLHPVHRMTPGRIPLELTEENCQDLKNLYLDTDLGQLDCLGEVLGVGDFQAVKERSHAVILDEESIRLIDLDALIEAKEAMKRPRDIEAALQLKAILEKQGS